MMVAVTSDLMAAEYSAEPRVRAWVTHDSNIRLSENDELSASGGAVEAAVRLGQRTPTLTNQLDLRALSTHYNRQNFSSDDQFVSWTLAKQWERGSFDLRADVYRDSTRDTEIGDTGVILGADRRERYFLAPSWNYYLSERQLLTISGSGEVINYDNERYTGYDYGQGTVGWTGVLTEKARVFVQGTYTNYKSEEQDFRLQTPLPIWILSGFRLPLAFNQTLISKSETYGLQIGAEYQWSEALILSVLGGRSKSNNSYELDDPNAVCITAMNLGIREDVIGLCGLDDNDGDVTTINASFSWQNDRNTITASATNQTQPTADGYLIESQRANAAWSYRLTELARISIDLSYGKNKAQDASPTQLNADRSNRDFYDARVRYKHQLTENWFVEADYHYRYSDREVISGVAESNAVMFGLRYEPQGWRWPR